jgi:hypothetical protein
MGNESATSQSYWGRRIRWVAISLVITGVLLGLVVGCGGVASQPQPVAEEVFVERAVELEAEEAGFAAPEMEAPREPADDSMQAVERLIIRTGGISMVVEDTRATRASIEGLVAEMAEQGAFVVSAEEYGGDTEGAQPHITMSIRVPASRFGTVMDRLAAMAVEVSSRNESAQDVTEEYVDLEARLESLEAARQRLMEIMEQARSTKDLLEAEQQLTQREAEIESIKGRMQYLEQSARLSSIWIELQPYILSQPVGQQWKPVETARRAVEALADALRGFGDFLIFFAIAVLPWLLLLVLAVYVVYRLARWLTRRRRKEPITEEPEAD